MKRKLIQKSIDIKASAEQVWKALTDDSLTRQWFAVFSEGTYADTDWKQGSKATFVDKTNCGMICRLAVVDPLKKIVLEYEGQIVSGQEDYTSDIAQQIKGGKESYTLSSKDGGIHLSIEQDMSDEYYEMMNASWDAALQKIKELSEN